ncbi:SRPBCC family protein [Kangiella sp. HZ709]|uniref:SRPBCC family protein n=1 Tax=Kangiella sp. HZ709 TaxID=2666328 RepID=UPI0012B13957|nr:SRPBCC family protein [Kangiella sp. HZ709]MRX26782.1 hypothetical protein [Kangiella sp. HZ709]
MKTAIDAPADIVFLWLEDNDRLKQWVPNLVSDETIVETPEKIGTKFQQVFLENGRNMEMIGEITEYAENKLMRVIMHGDKFELDVSYQLNSLAEAQTEVTQDTQIKFKGFMKIMTPIFFVVSKLSKNNPQIAAHAKLKEMAEQEYRSRFV